MSNIDLYLDVLYRQDLLLYAVFQI